MYKYILKDQLAVVLTEILPEPTVQGQLKYYVLHCCPINPNKTTKK